MALTTCPPNQGKGISNFLFHQQKGVHNTAMTYGERDFAATSFPNALGQNWCSHLYCRKVNLEVIKLQ